MWSALAAAATACRRRPTSISARTFRHCDIAECAAIAGITQNPSRYNPLIYPENNKDAPAGGAGGNVRPGEDHRGTNTTRPWKSPSTWTFVGYSQEAESEEENSSSVWNWYTEALYDDVKRRPAWKLYSTSLKTGPTICCYHGGLEIYCAHGPGISRRSPKRNICQRCDNYSTA